MDAIKRANMFFIEKAGRIINDAKKVFDVNQSKSLLHHNILVASHRPKKKMVKNEFLQEIRYEVIDKRQEPRTPTQTELRAARIEPLSNSIYEWLNAYSQDRNVPIEDITIGVGWVKPERKTDKGFAFFALYEKKVQIGLAKSDKIALTDAYTEDFKNLIPILKQQAEKLNKSGSYLFLQVVDGKASIFLFERGYTQMIFLRELFFRKQIYTDHNKRWRVI